MYWIEFFISSALIIAAGVHLTKYADRLSDALNLGKVWIGVVLLGFVTSLPEAITSISSIVQFDANDLAVGNLLGSNNFNLLLLVLVDFLYKHEAVTNKISPRPSHNVSAMLSALLMAIVVGDFIYAKTSNALRIGHLTYGMVLIGMLYFWGMSLLARLEKNQPASENTPDNVYPLSKIFFHLALSTIVVVFSAMWLTKSVDVIAVKTGLGRSFVGTTLLALVTSLPEMVVTISALRLGALDLALGNIFGSNMTNMFIMFVCSLVYTKGIFLATVNPVHIITPLFGIIMTFIVLWGIKNNNKRHYWVFGLDSILLIVLFLGCSIIIYFLK